MSTEKDTELKKKTTVISEDRVTPETRIYDASNKETRVVSKHKWIEEDEQVIKPVGRSTLSGTQTDLSRTRIADPADFPRGGTDSKTRVVRRGDTKVMQRSAARSGNRSAADRSAGSKSALGRAKDLASGTRTAGRLAAEDLRNVKVADRKKFNRFLKMIGVFLIILLLEIGYFVFASHVSGMPSEIKKAQKELSLTQKENKLLEEEIEALGDYNSTEELKESWERLKDKVEKAAEETYY